MSTSELGSLKSAAVALNDEDIHVWHVAYQPSSGRQPLLQVLAAYLDRAPSAIVLSSEEHGRPTLVTSGDQPLDFNWSHSGGDALIAIARHVRPGVDVERLRPRPRLLEIARRYFDPSEFALLERLPEHERLSVFLSLWTAKEAVLKALGRGLAFGLDRVGLNLAGDGAPALRHLAGSDVDSWQLQALSFDAELRAALAWQGEPRRVRTGMLTLTA